MADFSLPDSLFEQNNIGWGPSKVNLPDKFKDLPYQPFRKADTIGKVSDWTGATYGESRRVRMYQSSHGQNLGIFNNAFVHVNEDDDQNFKLVDNAPVKQTNFRGRYNNRYQQNQRGGWGNNNFNKHSNQQFQQRRNDKRFRNRNRYYNNNRPIHVNRESSVLIDSNWSAVDTVDFLSLSKLKTTQVSKGKDLLNCGAVYPYNKKYDACSMRQKVKLRQAPRTDFNFVTTSEDSTLKKLGGQNRELNVFGTEEIISQIMCCTRSNLPWDIVAHKIGGKILFDLDENRQNFSSVDMATVSETSNEPIQDETWDEVNKIKNLMEEATNINNCFAQQIIAPGKPKEGEKPYPFEPNNENNNGAPREIPKSRMYRYRQFDIGNSIKLLVRTKVDALGNNGEYMTCQSLNEWNSSHCNGVDWSRNMDRAATVLATEVKNNSFKMSKWITNALLAGANTMKLGFVTREHIKKNNSHLIVSIMTQKPQDFATIARLDIDNGWGILKFIIEKLREQKVDGKYYIVKNPNAKEITIYCTEQEDSDDEDAKASKSGSAEESSSGSEESSSGSEESSSGEDSSSEESSSEED